MTHTIRDEDGKIYVPVYYDVISAEIDKAYCFSTADKEVWLPKSQVIDIDSQNGEVIIPEWLAVEKGLA